MISISMFGSSFTVYQHVAVWGNIVLFYIVNLILSLLKHNSMYTIMFRVFVDPAYWFSLLVCISSKSQCDHSYHANHSFGPVSYYWALLLLSLLSPWSKKLDWYYLFPIYHSDAYNEILHFSDTSRARVLEDFCVQIPLGSIYHPRTPKSSLVSTWS